MPTPVMIADDLANQLRPYEAQLPEILELGIHKWQARGDTGYSGLSSVLETLAALPAQEEVLALRTHTATSGANRRASREKPHVRAIFR